MLQLHPKLTRNNMFTFKQKSSFCFCYFPVCPVMHERKGSSSSAGQNEELGAVTVLHCDVNQLVPCPGFADSQ